MIDSSPDLPLFFPSFPLASNHIYIAALPEHPEDRNISFELQIPLFFPVILNSTLELHLGIRYPRFSAHRPEDNHYRLQGWVIHIWKGVNPNVQTESTVPIVYTRVIGLNLERRHAQFQRNKYQRHIYYSAPLKWGAYLCDSTCLQTPIPVFNSIQLKIQLRLSVSIAPLTAPSTFFPFVLKAHACGNVPRQFLPATLTHMTLHREWRIHNCAWFTRPWKWRRSYYCRRLNYPRSDGFPGSLHKVGYPLRPISS